MFLIVFFDFVKYVFEVVKIIDLSYDFFELYFFNFIMRFILEEFEVLIRVIYDSDIVVFDVMGGDFQWIWVI